MNTATSSKTDLSLVAAAKRVLASTNRITVELILASPNDAHPVAFIADQAHLLWRNGSRLVLLRMSASAASTETILMDDVGEFATLEDIFALNYSIDAMNDISRNMENSLQEPTVLFLSSSTEDQARTLMKSMGIGGDFAIPTDKELAYARVLKAATRIKSHLTALPLRTDGLIAAEVGGHAFLVSKDASDFGELVHTEIDITGQHLDVGNMKYLEDVNDVDDWLLSIEEVNDEAVKLEQWLLHPTYRIISSYVVAEIQSELAYNEVCCQAKLLRNESPNARMLISALTKIIQHALADMDRFVDDQDGVKRGREALMTLRNAISQP